MNRYSGGPQVLYAGTYLAPLIPLAIVTAAYDPMSYRATLVDLVVLWLLGLALSYAMIAIHEAGHCLGARVAGIAIANVTIGHWRKLVTFRLGTMTVTLRAAPASGYVMPKNAPKNFSTPRMILFLLGGVVAEGGCVAWVWAMESPPGIASLGDLVLVFFRISVLWTGGWHVLFNLLPAEGWAAGEVHANDGRQLWRLWTERHTRPLQRAFLADAHRLNALCEAQDFPAALQWVETIVVRYPEEKAQLLPALARLHGECGAPAKAEAVWRDLLKEPVVSPSRTAEILDSLACLALYEGRSDLLGEAEAWTTEALRCAPNAITLKGTRGGVFIELGRIDAGIALLQEVIRRSECPIDQAISAAYLAKAYASQGDENEAQRWLKRAVALDGRHRMVQRIVQQLAAKAQPAMSLASHNAPPAIRSADGKAVIGT